MKTTQISATIVQIVNVKNAEKPYVMIVTNNGTLPPLTSEGFLIALENSALIEDRKTSSSQEILSARRDLIGGKITANHTTWKAGDLIPVKAESVKDKSTLLQKGDDFFVTAKKDSGKLDRVSFEVSTTKAIETKTAIANASVFSAVMFGRGANQGTPMNVVNEEVETPDLVETPEDVLTPNAEVDAVETENAK